MLCCCFASLRFHLLLISFFLFAVVHSWLSVSFVCFATEKYEGNIYLFFLHFDGATGDAVPCGAVENDSIHRTSKKCARRCEYIERACEWDARLRGHRICAVLLWPIAPIQSKLPCFLWNLSAVILVFVLAVSIAAIIQHTIAKKH